MYMLKIPKSGYAWLLLGLLNWVGTVDAQPAIPLRLSFKQAWQAALRQTPEMLKVRAQEAEARGVVKVAQGHLLPEFKASFAGIGSNNGLNVFGMKLNQGKVNFNDFGAGQLLSSQNPLANLDIAPSSLNNPGWYRNYRSKLELQIPVYNGGKAWAYLQQAETYLRAAHRGDVMARQRLEFQVLKAYEGIRAAQAFVGVAAQALRAAQSYVSMTDKLYRHGVVSRNTQLRAGLNWGDVRLRYSQTQVHLAKVIEQLRVLTGLRIHRPVIIDQNIEVKIPRVTLAELQSRTLLDNPGIQVLGLHVQGAQAGVQVARSAFLPHFNIVVSREWNDSSFIFAGQPSYTVAGILTWNIFGFGIRQGALDQAQAKVLQQAAELHQQQNRLRIAVTSAWLDMRLARQRVQLRQLAIRQAVEARRLQKLRYKNGIATIAQLLTAQAELDKARSALVAARYEEIMQRADLLIALGQLIPTAIITENAARNRMVLPSRS